MKKQPLTIMALVFFAIFLASCSAPTSSTSISASSKIESAPNSQTQSNPTTKAKQNKVRFSAVGDNLIHDGIYLQAQERAGGEGYDFTYAYENVSPFLQDFDVNWMNQETLISDEFPPSTYPMFCSPGAVAKATYAAGWRVFNIANNHTYDMGSKGIESTQYFWSTMPEDVRVAGLYDSFDGTQEEIVLQEVNGIKIAYLNYTEHTNGLPTPDNAPARVIYTHERDIMEKQIRKANELADAVVVSLHWGVEGSHQVTNEQRTLANDVVSWGADVILGAHPHVIQPVEWIENTQTGNKAIIVYSLGNFLSAQSAADNMIGMAFTFDLVQNTDETGTKKPIEIENVKVYPTITQYENGYKNIRSYMYKDYTDDLASVHGVRSRFPNFNKEYIESVLKENIQQEFLVLE